MDRLETLLEAIASRSRVLDSQRARRPSTIRGSTPRSDPTPIPTPKANCPKTPAPPARTKQTYPPMRPKWKKVTVLVEADKVCCDCFYAYTRAQVFMPLFHMGLVIRDEPEGYQHIISAYA